jgi:hypothetical protein
VGRFDEQAVQFVHGAVAWLHDREADRRVVDGSDNAYPAVVDEGVGQRARVRMGGKLRAIRLPDVG